MIKHRSEWNPPISLPSILQLIFYAISPLIPSSRAPIILSLPFNAYHSVMAILRHEKMDYLCLCMCVCPHVGSLAQVCKAIPSECGQSTESKRSYWEECHILSPVSANNKSLSPPSIIHILICPWRLYQLNTLQLEIPGISPCVNLLCNSEETLC